MFYIDACYSGLAKSETEKWLLKQKDFNAIKKWEIENSSGYLLKYFDRNSFLKLIIHTSCNSTQISNDDGIGKGGSFTNKFIANGDMYPAFGYKFFEGKDNQQTTQRLTLYVK